MTGRSPLDAIEAIAAAPRERKEDDGSMPASGGAAPRKMTVVARAGGWLFFRGLIRGFILVASKMSQEDSGERYHRSAASGEPACTEAPSWPGLVLCADLIRPAAYVVDELSHARIICCLPMPLGSLPSNVNHPWLI